MDYFELAENHLAGASLKRDAARVAQCAEVIAEGPAMDSRPARRPLVTAVLVAATFG
jgi:hypothetical protein